MTYPFLVLANRLPVDAVREGGEHPRWRRSPGGLVTAVLPIMRQRGGAWIGWHGQRGTTPDPFDFDDIALHPVALNQREVDHYYEGYSNTTIWPLYHDAVERPAFHRSWVHTYRDVNHRFAVKAAALAGRGATVWIHDYHLQLVPAMLRDLRPDLRIGFFLHIPFPPIELFSQLPTRTEILRGLLGADLVGFQQTMAATNFIRLAEHLLNVEYADNSLHFRDRRVVAGAFPISIDVDEVDAIARAPDVVMRARQIRDELGDPETVILGVDRLDYTKGIENRLTAFGELLAEKRLDPKRTVMLQVAVPSRQRVAQYQALRARVERSVGRINGEYATVGRPVVHYLHRSLDRRELIAFYLAADVMAVTPLRDGMNLVAKEYVATRNDLRGALVLSEFAGAADELDDAYLVNPHDIEALKACLVTATHAGPDERRRRLIAMRKHITTHDVNFWADSFLSELTTAEATTGRHGDEGNSTRQR